MSDGYSKFVDEEKLEKANFLYKGKIVTNKPNFDLSRDDARGIKCTLDYNFIICPVSQNFPQEKFKRFGDFFLVLKARPSGKVLSKLKGNLTPISEKILKNAPPFNFPKEILNYINLTKGNSYSRTLKTIFRNTTPKVLLDVNLLNNQIYIFNGYSALSHGSARSLKSDYCILDIELEDIPFYKGDLTIPTTKQRPVKKISE
ncbi:MAG: hypothetical protein NXH75_05830 [Halobacteriovoraceae bacterium]|nr:hypothetical protein [Halobacteriovoraceae bacterium]